jgi:hypothetical protein
VASDRPVAGSVNVDAVRFYPADVMVDITMTTAGVQLDARAAKASPG